MPFLIFVNAAILVFLILLSRSFPTSLRGSIFNPLLFLVLLASFFSVDFFLLYLEPYLEIYEEALHLTSPDVESAYLYYILCMGAMSMAFFIGLKKKGGIGSKLFDFVTVVRNDSDVVMYIVVTLSLFSSFVLLTSGSGLLSGDVSRQVFFMENKLLRISFSMIPPAFALFCRNQDPLSLKCLGMFLICIAIIFLTNSRGSFILLFLIYGYLFNAKVRKVSAGWVIVLIPMVAYLLLWSRYVFRESWRYDSMSEFVYDKGGLLGVFFQTAEVSMADVLTTIVTWSEAVYRYPFESFVAGIMYPLPRSIFTFKPLGSGGDFTSEFSPLRWTLTKSEIVTTGFGDLFLQFGYLGSLMVLFILSYLWVRLIKGAISYSSEMAAFIVPLLIWWMYLFTRSGIFNMSGAIWSALLVLFVLNFVGFLRNAK